MNNTYYGGINMDIRRIQNQAGIEASGISIHQQELLEFLFECESLAQDMVSASHNSVLMAHAVELCESYLKIMLDMLHVWQRFQHTQLQEADFSAQLLKVQEALQDVTKQIKGNKDKSGQAHYLVLISKLIDKILHLTQPPTQEIILPQPITESVSSAAFVQENTSSPCDLFDETRMNVQVHQDNTLQLSIHLFGEFRASLNGRAITRWSRGNGQKIFKFLLLHRSSPVYKERLMEAVWPDADIRSARNNLNVAIYYLRQNLSRYHKTFPFVLYQDGCYLLNPELSVWLDVEAFDRYIRLAQQHRVRHEIQQAVSSYHCAEALYQGDCLQDETDDNWASLIRQAYHMKYLGILEYLGNRLLELGKNQECVSLWQKALTLDKCNEEAHRRIITCYLKMGQRQMALRQYQLCEGALREELDFKPSPETLQLFEQIQHA